MPVFKRTRSKVYETSDSESNGSPTIGNRSNKRTRALGGAPSADHKLRHSPQKFMVYIVAVKLGTNRTAAGLSKLVEESPDYALAKNAEEADIIVTGIGMRQRLERTVSAELIVSWGRPSHTFWESDANCYPRTRSPSLNPSGWKSRSRKANGSHMISTKLSTSDEARPPAMRRAQATMST